jgi:hypothetical protein
MFKHTESITCTSSTSTLGLGLFILLVAEELGVAVVVLEISDHKKYEERFGHL